MCTSKHVVIEMISNQFSVEIAVFEFFSENFVE